MLLTKDYSRVAAISDFTGWITPGGKFLQYKISHSHTLLENGFRDEGNLVDQYGYSSVLPEGWIYVREETRDTVYCTVLRDHILHAKELLERFLRDKEEIETVIFERANDRGRIIDDITMRFDEDHYQLDRTL